MHAADITQRLEALGLNRAEYVVHSSASLVLRGILREANDIDIVAVGGAWQAALRWVKSGEAALDRGDYEQRVSLGREFEIYDGWLGEPAAPVVSRSELVNGVPCAPVQDVIAMKERLNRPKDRAHLKLIRAHQE